MSKAKFMMGVLDEVSSSSDSDDEDGSTAKAQAEAHAAPHAAADTAGPSTDVLQEDQAGPLPAPGKRVKLSLEDLQRAGYRAGPSVLFMKPPADDQQNNWEWGDGKEAKESEPQAESYEERRATHHAAGAGVEDSVAYSQRVALHAAKLREEGRLEKEQLVKEKRQAFAQQREEGRMEDDKDKRRTFNQKEKRKRDVGQATRGKNYVEEEKRLGRKHGMYSGFD